MPRKPILIEIFKDYKQILIKGISSFRHYPATYKLIRTNSKITLEELQKYVEQLQTKYPNHNFTLKTYNYHGRTLYVITRKSYIKKDTKVRVIRERVPIYFDIENQKIYVPKSYIKQQQKLTNYILMRTLGALGLARVKYVRMGAPP